MVPSADPEGDQLPAQESGTAEKTSESGSQVKDKIPAKENLPKENGKPKTGNNAQQKGKPDEASKEGKLSGKELKEKAKAEKAARRAKEKGQQGQPVIDLGTNKLGDQKVRRPSAPGAAASPMKGQHKRSGSTSLNTQKLPLRAAPSQNAPIAEELKKESKNVTLFDHLYGPPRRTTMAGAGKDVHPAVLALGLQMRNYVICGSSARCVATLLAFKRVSVLLQYNVSCFTDAVQVIESYITPPQNSLPRHLTTHLSSQIEYLVSCRPMSISMGNAIRWLKVQISAIDVSAQESSAKANLCEAIENYIQEKVTLADQVISKRANNKIKDGDVVLTFAKSSIVQQTLLEAQRQGKKFRVIVVDSRPLFEGKNLARALSDLGIEVQYSLIHGLSHVVKDATKVFLGAHAMMNTGKLFSRIGTALVAMMAKESNIPVIVCCESVKFADRSDLDSFVHNEIAPPEELIVKGQTSSSLSTWEDVPKLQLLNLMYDLTPAEYISMIITEYGPIPPSSVPVIQRLSTGT